MTHNVLAETIPPLAYGVSKTERPHDDRKTSTGFE